MRKRLFSTLAIVSLVLGWIVAVTGSPRGLARENRVRSRPTTVLGDEPAKTTAMQAHHTGPHGPIDPISPSQRPPAARRTVVPGTSPGAQEKNQLVYVTVRDAVTPFGMPVAGVHVVVGVARSAFGPPLTRPTPLTHIEVLGTGVSDDEGLVRIALRLPPSVRGTSKDGAAVLFARIEEAGLCRNQRLTPLAEVTAPEMRLMLAAISGVPLAGRVFSPAGAPVDHGLVEVYRAEEARRTGIAIGARAGIGLDGRFELNLRESGSWQVLARVKNVGAVTLRDVNVAPTPDPRPLGIRLGGSGSLSGRVLSRDEAPLPGLDLWAVPMERGDETDGSFSEIEHILAGSTPGTLDGKTTTTEDGFFAFRGLKEGSYLLRTTARASWGYDSLLTRNPVRTGTSGLLFHIEHPSLVVRLRDVQEDGVQARTGELPHFRSPIPLSLYVFRADAAGLPLTPTREVGGRRTSLGKGAYGIDVERGVDYLVGAFSSQHRPTEQRVRLDPQASTLEVMLDLPPAEPSGTLQIEVQTPDGSPLFGPSRVEVRSPGGATLFQDGFRDEGPEHRIELAPGTYELLVSAPAYRGWHGNRLGEARYGSRRLSVTVTARRTTELPVRLLPAGRVRFLVQLDSPPGRTSRSAETEGRDSPPREKLPGIRPAFLPADGGPALSALFAHRVEGRPVSLPADLETDWFAPGTEATLLDPLPAGPYRVRLSCEGYRSLLLPVTVRPDETVSVTATLRPVE